MTNYDHIHPDFRHVMAASDIERIRFMDAPRFIEYGTATTILDTLKWLLELPKRTRMPNILIVGEPNNGKTTLVEMFRDTHGQGYVNDDAEPVKPVILAESPPSADEKGLYMSLLHRFHAPYRDSAPASALRYQTIHLFRLCHVQMLIVDEFHSLLTGTAIKQREVMNAIKLLCNELRIPIVGVGTRDAVRVLGTDPQHASRFQVVPLPLWKPDRDFQVLLDAFEQVLPLKKPSGLHRGTLAQELHTHSSGNIGDLHRLLVVCASEAISSGAEQIGVDLVRNQARRLREQASQPHKT